MTKKDKIILAIAEVLEEEDWNVFFEFDEDIEKCSYCNASGGSITRKIIEDDTKELIYRAYQAGKKVDNSKK